MDNNTLEKLHQRIREMPEEDRQRLDPIIYALTEEMRRVANERGDIGLCIPNRVIALACLDLAMEWNQLMFEQE